MHPWVLEFCTWMYLASYNMLHLWEFLSVYYLSRMYQELDITGKHSKFKLIYIKSAKWKVTNSNLYEPYTPVIIIFSARSFQNSNPFSYNLHNVNRKVYETEYKSRHACFRSNRSLFRPSLIKLFFLFCFCFSSFLYETLFGHYLPPVFFL